MTPIFGLLLCAVVLLVVLCTSIACYSLRGFSRAELDEVCEQRGRADRFLDILKNWEAALVACEAVLTLASLAYVAVAIVKWDLLLSGTFSPAQYGEWFDLGMRWVILFLSLLLFAIVFPKSVAQVSGEWFLCRSWPLIQAAVTVVRPVVSLAGSVDTLFHRLYGIEQADPNDPNALTDEIRTVVDAGERMGAINASTGSMIDQVMDLKDADVGSVMTPRTETRFIRADMTVAEARAEILESRHTRIPVIGESTDDIKGILYAKDLLRYVDCSPEEMPSISEICREAMYVPETTGVDRLLETMNRKRVHMAIVLDEYGGVAGLVTMEDLLEEIVGEIADEDDDEEVDPVKRLSPTINEVDGRVHIDDLVEEFDYDLPEERDFDTIGGFVFSQLGRIPEVSETLEYGTLRFTILEADPRRILKLRIESDDSLGPVGHDD
ncbi:MAG: hemolysin family protein [Planctomycetota bacterium]|nr:hemolysin family protein [Planctomycetota bacterium]